MGIFKGIAEENRLKFVILQGVDPSNFFQKY